MIILRETYSIDGKERIEEKEFDTKNRIVKLLKKQTPVPSRVIYELTKKHEAIWDFNGVSRKFEIIEGHD